MANRANLALPVQTSAGSDRLKSIEPARFLAARAQRWITAFPPLALSLFVIYGWFGVLKLVGDSPAQELVLALFPGAPERMLLSCLGLWEMALGFAILLPSSRQRVIPWVFLHLAATSLPLFLLPKLTFSSSFAAPTLMGQYILKNLVLAAAVWELRNRR